MDHLNDYGILSVEQRSSPWPSKESPPSSSALNNPTSLLQWPVIVSRSLLWQVLCMPVYEYKGATALEWPPESLDVVSRRYCLHIDTRD